MRSIWSDTLTVEWVEGEVSQVVCPYTTDWRTMPYAMVARWTGGRVLWETDMDSRVIEDGDALVAPAGLRHRVTTPPRGTVTCEWAHLRIRVLGHIDLLELLDVPRCITADRAETLGWLCAEAAKTPAQPDDGMAALRRFTRCMHMLDILLDCVQPHDIDRKLERNVLRLVPLLTRIHNRYAESWTRDSLARLAGLSPSQFHAVFRQAMGVPPLEYVHSVRMRHAQDLLLRTADPIGAIAAAVGYRDPFHFSRLFKARFGLSPGQYRQQVQESMARMTPSEG